MQFWLTIRLPDNKERYERYGFYGMRMCTLASALAGKPWSLAPGFFSSLLFFDCFNYIIHVWNGENVELRADSRAINELINLFMRLILSYKLQRKEKCLTICNVVI